MMVAMSDLWWGTAASAVQTEGAAPNDNWYAWERAGKAPLSGDGNGFALRYREDFDLLAQWGFSQHRLSLNWARVIPEPGKIDESAVAYYRDVLSAGQAAGLKMWVTLLHSAIPQWFATQGGFASPTALEHWMNWVKVAAERFADLVDGWMPINNPMSYAYKGYLTGTFPPGQQSQEQFAAVLATLHRADFAAAIALAATGKPRCSNESLVPLYPADDSEQAALITRRFDAAVWDSWLSAARAEPDAFTYIGFTYYYAIEVSAVGEFRPYPPDQQPGPLGYVPWAPGLGVVLDRLTKELPGQQLVLAELGFGSQIDTERSAYFTQAIEIIEQSRASGTNLAGIFAWTGIDNYEWNHGYDVLFGLFDKDRRPKGSAHVVRELIRQTTSGV